MLYIYIYNVYGWTVSCNQFEQDPVLHKEAAVECLRWFGCEIVDADIILRKTTAEGFVFEIPVQIKVADPILSRTHAYLPSDREVILQEENKRQMEAISKMLVEAMKQQINAVIWQKVGEDARIDMGPDNKAETTSVKAVESMIHRVNKVALSTSAQGSYTLISLTLMNNPSSRLSRSPALFAVVAANTLAFICCLTSLCLRVKKPKVSSILARVGALALTAASLAASSVFISHNVQLLGSLLAIIPIMALIYA